MGNNNPHKEAYEWIRKHSKDLTAKQIAGITNVPLKQVRNFLQDNDLPYVLENPIDNFYKNQREKLGQKEMF